MKRGRPGRAAIARGVCPVCRAMVSLLNNNGKVAKHGRTAAAPGGCAGSYQAPMRRSTRSDTPSGTVVGFRPGDDGPTAHPGEQPADPDPDPQVEVPVVQRHPTKDWRTVRPPDGPDPA